MSGRWLLLRRLDALWGVPSAAVRGVHRSEEGAVVTLGSSSSLQADEVLSMAPELVLRDVPTCLAPQPRLAGLAVWKGEPVLCIDPTAALPAALQATNPQATEEPDARDV